VTEMSLVGAGRRLALRIQLHRGMPNWCPSTT